MADLGSEILNILCKGVGQGNSNTTKITDRITEANPKRDYNQTKIEVVESLQELVAQGELQIMTINWEVGEEFLYVCSNVIE